ncbi:fatty acyl-AMP ligase [Nocardia tengchongensis]|uniref:fatty acyl-AMP ligase n=1 Tax=Nocardia tengchongensis TaxID=2055889 RepID=UPI003683E296
MTFTEALNSLDVSDRGFSFVVDEDVVDFVSFVDFREQTADLAVRFAGLGLKRGDRVLMVLPDQKEFALLFAGMIRAGVVPVPVFPPFLLGQLEAYKDKLRGIVASCTPSVVVTAAGLAEFCTETTGLPAVTFEDVTGAPPTGILAEAEPDDIAFLQYTSGSTAEPKGVMVTQRSLVTNARFIADGIGIDPSVDRGVSWLPLYHDMGLIGFLVTPLVTQSSTWLIPPQQFARKPRMWLDWLSRVKGTISFAPNFAYELLASRVDNDQLAGWDLSSWRVAGCGAEPIRPDAIRRFQDRMASAGFNPRAMTPCYGLAEATLAVSFNPLGAGLKVTSVDVDALRVHGEVRAAGSADHVVELVSCGRVPSAHDVWILDEDGTRLPDGRQGEIAVRGDSVTAGYWGDPARTAETFGNGFLRTGDLGFIHDGDLYVTGRIKDLIIHNGRNYHPQDIEWVIGALAGVRTGHAAAFQLDDGELVVVAERAPAVEPTSELCGEIGTLVRKAVGILPDQVLVVPRDTIPKTSSGKIRRFATRQLLLTGELRELVRS